MHLFSPWQTEVNFVLLIWLNEKVCYRASIIAKKSQANLDRLIVINTILYEHP